MGGVFAKLNFCSLSLEKGAIDFFALNVESVRKKISLIRQPRCQLSYKYLKSFEVLCCGAYFIRFHLLFHNIFSSSLLWCPLGTLLWTRIDLEIIVDKTVELGLTDDISVIFFNLTITILVVANQIPL